VLDCVVKKTRVASQKHWACALTGGDVANLVRCVLRPLTEAGLLKTAVCFARPWNNFETPILTWNPGDPEPDFGKAAYQIERHWHGSAPRAIRACTATRKAAALFGATRFGCKNVLQSSHDLAVSSVYQSYRRLRPREAALWVGENMLETRPGEKCPDALLVQDHKTIQAIEIGGVRYSRTKIAAFHVFCRERELPYVLF
jgi:hypothetical protein